MNPRDKIQCYLNHLHWFYNADMTDKNNQEDFLSTLDKIAYLLAKL